MFTIGCHLSSAKGYLKMAQDAASIDGNTFQFFTRNPRGGKAKAIDPADVAAFHEFAGAHGITTFLAHAPYTMNPAAAKPETRAFAIELLTDDLMRMENTPGQLYNMHPRHAPYRSQRRGGHRAHRRRAEPGAHARAVHHAAA